MQSLKEYKHNEEVREYLRLKQARYRQKQKVGKAAAVVSRGKPNPEAINSYEVKAQ